MYNLLYIFLIEERFLIKLKAEKTRPHSPMAVDHSPIRVALVTFTVRINRHLKIEIVHLLDDRCRHIPAHNLSDRFEPCILKYFNHFVQYFKQTEPNNLAKG